MVSCSRASRLATICAALAVGLAAPARGERHQVALLAVSGAPDGALGEELARALGEQATVVDPSAWEGAAKRLVATSRRAADVAAVAQELGVAVVLAPSLKREPGPVLLVSVRHGPSGRSVEKLRYPLSAKGRLERATAKRLGEELAPAVARAAAATPTESPGDKEAEATESGSAPKAPGEPAAPPPTVEKDPGPGRIRRPPWSPYVDLSAGLLVSGRRFLVERMSDPFFASTVAAGLHLDLSVYPLAALATRPGGLVNAVTGLGLGASFDAVFWPDAVPCAKEPLTGQCAVTSERYAVREYRLEAGLRWHWNPAMKVHWPELALSLQYGLHTFAIAKRADGRDVGPPDTSYSYLSIGLGGRIPLGHFIALVPRLHLHVLGDLGPITAATEYGPGGGFGLRAGGGIELTLWDGITLRLEGFYERFGLSFSGAATPPPSKLAGGAVDEYYGGLITLGYIDHRAWSPDRDGDGLPDREDRCPEEPGPRDHGGCPLADGDGDGVADRDDRCPQAVGPRATAGCPDGDHDGVADLDDRCPKSPGPKEQKGCPDGDGDGVHDHEDDCPRVPGEAANRGCPTYKAIKVTAKQIELAEKIFFAYDRVDILPKSYALLDEVVQALTDHPALTVRILGHTDATGNEAHNLVLSEGRAGAVRDYLIAHGVAAERLEAKGYGAQFPIDSNKTLSGRENNRRVEFLILGTANPTDGGGAAPE